MNEESIFAEACTKKPPAERAAYLDGVCGKDKELRSRIEQLLEAHAHPDEFLEAPPPGVEQGFAQTMAHATSFAGAGIRIGRYKLLEEIGEGGMGTVWVAEQTEPVRRKVALKLVKPGMDSRQVVARFNAERQALAVMDHPNIAKVYDGGLTEQGRPYFVMEYVKGVPLTEYCDQAKLSLRERLQLFVPVCQAVQHAHQKGIIHRDLKPSNILACLYDGHPVPKVIDFGLAKAMHQPLTEQTLHTAHGMMLGTPMYMSPEQAEFNNLDVDTRTDIYSLGVILYELLTGTTPLEKQQFKEAALNEILRLIKEVEPPKPSTRLSGSASLPSIASQRSLDATQLRRSVRGDLDWIVMKALDKERSRRYETANGLARDIERFLNDEAVEACPPSTVYRLTKFAKKHKSLIVTASGIAFVLLLSMLIVVAQRNRAVNAEFVATREKDKALRSADEERMARERAQTAETEAKYAVQRAEQQENNAKRQVYFTEMLLAWDEYREGNIAEARRLVNNHIDSPGKGLEWKILNYELAALGEPWMDVGDIVPVGLEVTADNRSIAVEGDSRWHLFTPGSNPSFSVDIENNYFLKSCSLSSNGCFLAYRKQTGLFFVRDLRTSEDFVVRHDGLKPECVALFPDQSRTVIATAQTNGTVTISNWKSGEIIGQWTPRESQEPNRGIDLFPVTLLSSNHNIRSRLKWSRDGSFLAWLGNDGWLRVWNQSASKLIHAWKHDRGLLDVDFASDGTAVATCALTSPHEIYVWSMLNGKSLGRLTGHTAIVNSVLFLPNGTLASSGRDNTIRIWDPVSARLLATIRGHSDRVSALTVDRTGQQLYSASLDGEIRRWNLNDFNRSTEFNAHELGQIPDLETTTDGRQLLLTQRWVRNEGRVQVIDLVTGERMKDLVFDTPIIPIAVSASDILAAGGHGVVYLHDVKTGRRLELPTGNQEVLGLDISPDGRFLAASEIRRPHDGPRHLFVWDIKDVRWDSLKGLTPVFSQELEDPRVVDLEWSPDGTKLAGAGQKGLYLWDATNWNIPPFIGGAHSQPVRSVAWSPDGKSLASCSFDCSIRVLDLSTKTDRAFNQAHSGFVWEIAFSYDGTEILSTSGDDTVGIWDVKTGKLRARLPGHVDGAKSLLLTPDGKRLITGGLWDGKIRVWRLE